MIPFIQTSQTSTAHLWCQKSGEWICCGQGGLRSGGSAWMALSHFLIWLLITSACSFCKIASRCEFMNYAFLYTYYTLI